MNFIDGKFVSTTVGETPVPKGAKSENVGSAHGVEGEGVGADSGSHAIQARTTGALENGCASTEEIVAQTDPENVVSEREKGGDGGESRGSDSAAETESVVNSEAINTGSGENNFDEDNKSSETNDGLGMGEKEGSGMDIAVNEENEGNEGEQGVERGEERDKEMGSDGINTSNSAIPSSSSGVKDEPTEDSETTGTGAEDKGNEGERKSLTAGLTINAALVNDETPELNETDFKPLADNVIDKLPSLRGKVEEGPNEGGYIMKGAWGMNDNAHKSAQKNTSEWELILTEPVMDSPSGFDGKWCGYFVLKGKTSNQKIADSVHIKFCPVQGKPMFHGKVKQAYNVIGKGVCNFGSYSIQGHLNADNTVQIYKIYDLKPGSTPSLKRRKSEGGSKKLPTTPRESTPRASSVKATVQPALSRQPSLQRSSSSSRSQRQPVQIIRCGELLKEISKIPSSQWFAEPVDHVRLNLPDYPTIIKNPMDFSTIRGKLEGGEYSEPEQFAEDMRLVFRNAMTYNSAKDSFVHIAAREISGKFEDKFRVLTAHWASGEPGGKVQAAAEPLQARSVKASKASKAAAKTAPPARERAPAQPMYTGAPVRRLSSGGGPGRPPLQHIPSSVASAPAPVPAPAPIPTAGLDDATAQMMQEMQRTMAALQAEVVALRSQQQIQAQQVHHAQNLQQAPPSRSSSYSRSRSRDTLPLPPVATAPPVVPAPVAVGEQPLTLAEKKTLIQQIHTLKPERLEKVVEIIQEAITPRADGGSEEVEIPIDELDTATLRKLQEFVEGKKKVVPSKNRLSSGVGGAAASKKSRKAEPPMQAYIPGKTEIPPAPTSNTTKLQAQANSGLLPSLQTLKRPRSDSLEFDDLVSGSHELLDGLDDMGKGGSLPLDDTWVGTVESKGSELTQETGREISWGTAIDEKEATKVRELDRKAEEERQFEERAKAEAERLQALQRDAAKKEEERQRALADEEHKKNEQQRLVLAAREEERKLREEMQQTVNLDNQHEALMMLDDI